MKQTEGFAPTFAIDPCCDGGSCQKILAGKRWSLQKHKLVDSAKFVGGCCWTSLLQGGKHQESKTREDNKRRTQAKTLRHTMPADGSAGGS